MSLNQPVFGVSQGCMALFDPLRGSSPAGPRHLWSRGYTWVQVVGAGVITRADVGTTRTAVRAAPCPVGAHTPPSTPHMEGIGDPTRDATWGAYRYTYVRLLFRLHSTLAY